MASDGTLDAYVAQVTARARCKNGKDRAFAAWGKLDALNGYSANWRNFDALPDREAVVARSMVGNDLIDALGKFDYLPAAKVDWVEYDRVLTEGLARLADLTAELETRQVGAAA